MFDRNMTKNVQKIISQHIQGLNKIDLTAVDATLGNGYDLEFLNAQNAITKIYGFDIQQKAIEESKKKIQDSHKQITLICDSHHQLDEYVKEEIDLALFNLGYLPSGDKGIVTTHEYTLVAIKKVLSQLAPGGIVSIMTYPGHREGAVEEKMISEYMKTLHKKELSILRLSVENVVKAAPNAYIIIKRN